MPDRQPTARVMGPASCFPSMRKTYGRPIAGCLELVRTRPEAERHTETVAWLQAELGMGRGHANAIVACVRAARRESLSRKCHTNRGKCHIDAPQPLEHALVNPCSR